jgi:phosphate transport system permease protein
MSSSATTQEAGESRSALGPASLLRARASRRRLADRLARCLISFGGIAIIACILAILLVILGEALPLFRPAAAAAAPPAAAAIEAPAEALLVDEYHEVAGLVTTRGIRFLSLQDGATRSDWAWPLQPPAVLAGVSPLRDNAFAAGFEDGRVLVVETRFTVTYPGTGRRVVPEVVAGEPLAVPLGAPPARRLALARTPDGWVVATAGRGPDVHLLAVQETKPLVGPARREVLRRSAALPVEGEITALAVDSRGQDLFVGSATGQIVRAEIAPGAIRPVETTGSAARPAAAVSALAFLIGDRTLVSGDAAGGVRTWQVLPGEDGVRRLAAIHDFRPHDGPVIAVSPSPRDKGFVTADARGTVRLHNATSAATLLDLRAAEGGLRDARLAPKADALLAVDAGGRIAQWTLDAPHPEITLRTLFGKVWYEGYTQPEHVWQSSGSTDDFEAKLGLVPLLFGTLKGTFYALLIAVPLAILGALYTAQFMHPRLKANVKPVVELMAGIPSVVLGMLAGLWLAPRVEKVLPGIFLMGVVIPATILAALGLWRMIPLRHRAKVRPGWEIGLLLPLTALGAVIALGLGAWAEAALPGGNVRDWIRTALGLTYDQRNSIVVGIAMGFAVIPIIFTIAEDAVANVPPHLTAGSLALGATPWQTALRVVLPAASPAIFSAVMIGFGRAVGETMIMVMATGNTPILDLSPFNGFRALSANIAVELPEAPQGGSLFRILFLTAFLLFCMTFVVNTAAELVRLRLRRRFSLL